MSQIGDLATDAGREAVPSPVGSLVAERGGDLVRHARAESPVPYRTLGRPSAIAVVC